MVAALQWKVELFAMHSVGEAGSFRLRSQFVLRGLASKLQDASVINRSIFHQDGKGHRDTKLCPMYPVGDDQAAHFSFCNGPLRADRLIFQGEVVSSLRGN